MPAKGGTLATSEAIRDTGVETTYRTSPSLYSVRSVGRYNSERTQ